MFGNIKEWFCSDSDRIVTLCNDGLNRVIVTFTLFFLLSEKAQHSLSKHAFINHILLWNCHYTE